MGARPALGVQGDSVEWVIRSQTEPVEAITISS